MDSNEFPAMIGCLGILTTIVGWVWTVLLVMRNSPFMALLCLVVPCLLSYFVYSTWPDAKRPFLVWLGGVAVFVCTIAFVQ